MRFIKRSLKSSMQIKLRHVSDLLEGLNKSVIYMSICFYAVRQQLTDISIQQQDSVSTFRLEWSVECNEFDELSPVPEDQRYTFQSHHHFVRLNGLMVTEGKGQLSLDCTFRSHSLRQNDTQLRGGHCRTNLKLQKNIPGLQLLRKLGPKRALGTFSPLLDYYTSYTFPLLFHLRIKQTNNQTKTTHTDFGDSLSDTYTFPQSDIHEINKQRNISVAASARGEFVFHTPEGHFQ